MKLNSNLKGFLSDSALYFLLNIVNKAIPFLLLPIILGMVTTAEYGIYALFLTTEALFIPIIGMNLHGAVTRHYYEKDNFSFPLYFSTIVWLPLLVLFVVELIVFLLPSYYMTTWSGLSIQLFQLAIVSAGFTSIINMLLAYLRVERNIWLFGGVTLAKSIILFVLIILFLKQEPNAEMIAVARVACMLLFGIISFFLFKKERILLWKRSKKLLRKALRFALPSIPYSLAALIFVASDKYLVEYYLSSTEVGLYSGVTQIASLMSVIAMSFNAAWVPWLFENLKKEENSINKLIVKVSYACMFVFGIGAFLFGILFPYIAHLMLTPEFIPHLSLGYFLIIGFAFQGAYFVVIPYVNYVEKTEYLSYISIFSAIINVCLNIWLIPKMGISGAAMSTCIAWIILFIGASLFSYFNYKMPWNLWSKEYLES